MNEDSVDTSSVDLDNIFFDIDFENLSYTCTGMENIGVNIDPETHLVSLTPFPDWFGTESIAFTASDSEANVTETVIVIVQPRNDPPRLISAETVEVISAEQVLNFNVKEDGWLNITLTCEDIDGDGVEISSNRSDFIGIDDIDINYLEFKGDVLYFHPDNSLVGQTPIMVFISDSNGSIVNYTFVITVLNINNPPEIELTGPPDGSNYQYGEPVELIIDYSDNDLLIPDSDEALTIICQSNLSSEPLYEGPARTNLSFTSLIPGIHEITITINDKDGLESKDSLCVVIEEELKEEPEEEQSFIDNYGLFIILIILIIIILVSSLYVLRLRKRLVEIEVLSPAKPEPVLGEPYSAGFEKIQAPAATYDQVQGVQAPGQLPASTGIGVSAYPQTDQAVAEPAELPPPQLPPAETGQTGYQGQAQITPPFTVEQPPGPVPVQTVLAPAEQPPAAPQMAACPSCRQQIAVNTTPCPHCGQHFNWQTP
jgi:hypothetical protein